MTACPRADPPAGGPPGTPGAWRARLHGPLGIAGLTLVSRVLGFLRWIVQASTVGAGTVAGAYTTANQVPNVLYEVVVGGALAATVVPLLAAAAIPTRSRDASRIASGLLGVVLAVLTPLALLLALLADPIARLLPVSAGADPALQTDLVADFLRMFSAQVPLYGVGVVLTGVLQAMGRFAWPALTPVLSSLVVMATYAVYGAMTTGPGDQAGPAALSVLGWGTTAGVAALSLPLLYPVVRLGIRLRPTLHLDRAVAWRALRLGGAGVWTLVAQQLSVLAVLALARSGGRAGTVAVYQYTQAVYMLPYAVMAVPVATVVYPRLAAAFDPGGHGGAGRGDGGYPARAVELAAASTALMAAVALAGSGMLMAASAGAERFFALLTDVDGMGLSLAVLSPGLVGYALVYQVTRILFAASRPRYAARATALGWATVAGASAVAVRLMAPGGGDGRATLVALAMGTTIGMSVAGLGMLAALAMTAGARALGPTLRTLAVGAPVALAAGIGARALSARVDSVPGAIAVAAAGATGAAALVMGACMCAGPRLLDAVRPGAAAGPPTTREEQ
ncbi:hypothetical protein OHJ16_05445 [Actinomyces israelii]|uniref:Virulence factor MviN n=1 Tax=Actinomyces israelii TaxID=1659 RepID=A0ABT4I6Y4_9ACTO|nr:lipid II flippase MurJ [Actinomyces israelii]MCZ0857486.1 hypothetical protein [Actinomyces israelii]WKR21474.1 lipid II flippase MurJ [Actinomyces israelii]